MGQNLPHVIEKKTASGRGLGTANSQNREWIEDEEKKSRTRKKRGKGLEFTGVTPNLAKNVALYSRGSKRGEKLGRAKKKEKSRVIG